MSNKQQFSLNRFFLTAILAFIALVVVLQARPTFAQSSNTVVVDSTEPPTPSDENVDSEMLVDPEFSIDDEMLVEPEFSVDEEIMVDPGYVVDPFPYNDPYQLAAETIGIDLETLWSEWYQGKSLAEIAQAHNVSADAVIATLAKVENEMIDQSLTDGYLTEQDAAEWRSEVVENATSTVHYHYIEYPDFYAIAAKLIGVDVEVLYQLEGQSLLQFANEHGIDEATLTQALTDEMNRYIDKQVEYGQLTAEEAQAQQNAVAQDVSWTINWVYIAYPDPYQLTADMLGISLDELYTQLDNGTTIAQLAEQHGIATQTIIDALVAAENQYIDAMLADGQITAEDAASWRENVVESQTNLVNESWNVEPMQFDIR